MPGGRDINVKLRPKKQINNLIIPRTGSVGARLISSIRNNETKDLSNYMVLKTIGKGNFAKVKLARHKLTKKEVAVKIIDKTRIPAESLQKLFREVVIIKSLEHPNIVRLYEVIQTENMIYLIMEYVSGGELFDNLVNRGRMKEADARLKFRQAVSAIQYCHSKQIVHRDLKAENLLLDAEGNIKIADFGFCNKYDGETYLNTFCGSPPYAAPELFLGNPYYGPEVDIWSLGVILFTMVTGTLPFDGENLKDLKKNVLNCRYRVPFYVSNSCEALLRKMIVKDSSRRKPLEEIMKDEWMNKGFEVSCFIKPYSYSPEQMDDSVRINKLVSMGIDPTFINTSLQKLDYNHIMATYLLLKENKVDANFVNTSPKLLSQEESKGETIVAQDYLDANCNVITKCESVTEIAIDIKNLNNSVDESAEVLDAFKILVNTAEKEVPNSSNIEEKDVMLERANSNTESFRKKGFTNIFLKRKSKKIVENKSEKNVEKPKFIKSTDEGEHKKSKFYRRLTVAVARTKDPKSNSGMDRKPQDEVLKRASNAANVHKIVNANPKDVIPDLLAVFQNCKYVYVKKNESMVIVTIETKGEKKLLKIEFELTRLWFSQKYAIKLNRLKGSSMEYKNYSRRLLSLYCDYVTNGKPKL